MNEVNKTVLQLITEKGPIKSTQIAETLNIDLKSITNIIRTLRKEFYNGKADVYIYTTPDGYSVNETKRAVVYETNLRLAQMIGMGINSQYIRQRCRKIALPEFKKLSILYKPTLLLIEKELK